jgi:fumarate reductase flavoprotein subunit
MWEDVGILRTADRLRNAQAKLADLDLQLSSMGVGVGSDPAFNLTWHDWLNLKNLITISQLVATAALAREDSRGAHFREDFPETRGLHNSTYTVVRLGDAGTTLSCEPVKFTRVQPGMTILQPELAV